MTLFSWIAFGLVAGLAARKLINRGGSERLLDCMLQGCLGALLGGSLFGLVGSNVAYGLAGAAAGAIAMLSVCAHVRRRGTAVAPAGRA
jgi:uncharacterized membrane protein YeaQ/YmgE (transglycosylase-associated protein family)